MAPAERSGRSCHSGSMSSARQLIMPFGYEKGVHWSSPEIVDT